MGKIQRVEAQTPRSRFLRIKCPDCESEQITFNKAAIRVNCQSCGATLVDPKGGFAQVRGKIVAELD